MKRFSLGLFVALAIAGFAPGLALADETAAPATPPTPSASIEVYRADLSIAPLDFYQSAPGTQGPYPWSAWRWSYTSGEHSLDFTGGLTSRVGAPLLGEGLSTDVLSSSLTYHYRLFGGVLRPVALITVGGARWYDPVGGASLRGFQSTGALFASAEAGMEIVVQGYGLGVTAQYVVPVAFDQALAMHDKHKGPRTFDPDRADFLKQWRLNVYPIIDQP